MDNSQNPKPSRKHKPYKSFIQFSGLAIQMGITIYLGHLLGGLIDEKLNNTNELYSKTVTLIAVFLSTFAVIRQVIKLNDD